jgi:hypothetical protein
MYNKNNVTMNHTLFCWFIGKGSLGWWLIYC